MTTNTDHLIVRNIDEGHLFVCAHCGAAEIVRLPIALADWLAQSRRFQKAHRHCQPQAARPDGRTLFDVVAADTATNQEAPANAD